METVARALLGLALLIAIVGAGLLLAAKLGWSGRLPGDIVLRRGSWSLYVPLGLSILVSVVLTVVLNVLLRR